MKVPTEFLNSFLNSPHSYAPRFDDNDTCVTCTPVAGSDSAVTTTCTSEFDSRATCSAGAPKKTPGTDAAGETIATADTCAAACPVGSFDTDTSGAEGVPDPTALSNCEACTAISGAADGAIFSCSGTSDSIFSSGGCEDGRYLVPANTDGSIVGSEVGNDESSKTFIKTLR
jgi:hypothetical protein